MWCETLSYLTRRRVLEIGSKGKKDDRRTVTTTSGVKRDDSGLSEGTENNIHPRETATGMESHGDHHTSEDESVAFRQR